MKPSAFWTNHIAYKRAAWPRSTTLPTSSTQPNPTQPPLLHSLHSNIAIPAVHSFQPTPTTSSIMDSIAIKFYSSADGDVRRTRLDTGADFNALSKQASAAFGVDGDIKWKDEDGDLVNVKCDGDWRECINYNGGGGAIKLHFFPHTTDGAPGRQQQQQQQQRSESPVEPIEIEVISPPPDDKRGGGPA